jgi:mannan endo-1,4-beta-mannosidase
MLRRSMFVALAAIVLAPTAAQACLRVGVYQDRPVSGHKTLTAAVGPGVTALSVYVGATEPVPGSVIDYARSRKLQLIVAWQPDDRPATLARVANGTYDRALRRLVRQIRGLKPSAILRPMPEPNTPWYPWSGSVRRQGGAAYIRAFRHVRLVARRAAGRKPIRVMWTSYARSVPEEATNEIRDYFPGRAHVDLVGAVAYNFGVTDDLDWSLPQTLFGEAYDTIDALARKPFWIAETGTTSAGGSKADWLAQLTAAGASMPRLKGVVLYDVTEPNGDFRLRETPESTAAVTEYLKGACRR